MLCAVSQCGVSGCVFRWDSDIVFINITSMCDELELARSSCPADAAAAPRLDVEILVLSANGDAELWRWHRRKDSGERVHTGKYKNSLSRTGRPIRWGSYIMFVTFMIFVLLVMNHWKESWMEDGGPCEYEALALRDCLLRQYSHPPVLQSAITNHQPPEIHQAPSKSLEIKFIPATQWQ